MKKIFIFEGIASSGKTTLQNMLIEKLPNAILIDETETLMPLIDNHDVVKATSHLSKLLEKIERSSEDNIIIDRFHYTHAFRTNSTLAPFREIEEKLGKYSTLVIFLKISDKEIPMRIKETTELRGDNWKKGKQGTLKERVAHYRDQQTYLENLHQQTILPYKKIDTSDKDWQRCFDKIKNASE